jgi:hypothetical protein
MPLSTAEDQQRSFAEFRTEVLRLAETMKMAMRQLELLRAAFEHLQAERSGFEALPERARVKIVGTLEDAPELTGRTGVALAGGPTDSGWSYTVLVDGMDESYVLPRSALLYLGDAIPMDHLYSGESLRVQVNEDGTGRVVGHRVAKRRSPR